MIFTLVGADFSKSNIGTLSNWMILRELGAGATYTGPSFVEKNTTFSATVTLSEGYEIGSAGITITMGGTALDESYYSVVDNVITFTIASVTGSVVIKVPTLNTTTGEEEVIPNYIFTINPTPTDATVTLSATGYSTVSGTGTKSITVADGTKVDWSVSANGYTTRDGNWTINGGNKTENIVLSEEENTGFVDPRLSHPQTKASASVPSNGIITEDMTIVLEDCWMNGTFAYLSWNPMGSNGENNTTYTDDYFYCYLPVNISGYTKIDITANNDNASYYQFFTADLSFTTTGERIKVDKGTSVTAQTIPDGAKYLLLAHHRIKEGAYSDYYPTTVKLYN